MGITKLEQSLIIHSCSNYQIVGRNGRFWGGLDGGPFYGLVLGGLWCDRFWSVGLAVGFRVGRRVGWGVALSSTGVGAIIGTGLDDVGCGVDCRSSSIVSDALGIMAAAANGRVKCWVVSVYSVVWWTWHPP